MPVDVEEVDVVVVEMDRGSEITGVIPSWSC